ncbi:glutaminase domain-containing protein [Bacteroides sp. 224]|uniref:glutaminase domain-containing protein n=1 Tax=Bacteroides sp. 224 TaxID=2302936 RepID=UPI0013D40383|nr:DUF4965 domain-containing protein [Bacteroides sp. 224]NDV66583.1 DUF4965 domain-containing protein [Bacteroides sp. 224]
MKKLLIITALVCLGIHAQATDLFKSSQDIKLRAPSVPLITSDTYFAIWSPYNTLTEGNTEHWTAEEHPLIGALRVDGKVYRFMGKDKLNLETLLPMANQKHWETKFTMNQPSAGWEKAEFNDANWKTGKGAFGTKDMRYINTEWNTKDIWVRRTFELDRDLTKETIYLRYSHDDVFELYLNGEKLVATDYSWNNDVTIELSAAAKKKFRKGTNVIAAHCQNTTGGAYLDFGLYRKQPVISNFTQEAIQKSVDVLPTQTFYTFVCGPVELDLVFTAPLLMEDIDLISTPINYISYRVRSLDKKEHDVQVYIETTPQLTVHQPSQPTISTMVSHNGMNYIKSGTIDQPYTIRKGDGVRIDWGYLYLSAPANEANKSLSIGNYYGMKQEFISTGKLMPTQDNYITRNIDDMPALAYTENLGKVNRTGKDGYLMLGYDDIYSIEYFYKRRMAYWKHNGKVTIFDAFDKYKTAYPFLMNRCREFDKQLLKDAEQAGGKEYAEICALVYRHAITAHKVITDDAGNLLFLSKENHSNGCINTVDLTYPSAPLFLIYNPELMKGMMTSIFYYSESGRWNKPYPAHDLGTYPIANGQLYGEDMPVEEAGNMVILAAAISLIEGNASYAEKHWETLSTWANYLLENGLDPQNQLCTDDFAGHLAHNANLSMKAIMAIAGYGEIARMLGKDDLAAKYNQAAKKLAIEWEKMANDGDHYKLAFDKSGTWSQKYNMVWDKVFNWNIFPSQIAETEVNYYLTKQNKYSMPLDSRKDYTKSDWVLWSACLAKDQATFEKFIAPIYVYANETTSRVPISDWHDTHTGKMMNFKARSVVGGYYMKLLMEKIHTTKQ